MTFRSIALCLGILLPCALAEAHPVPFSYLDLRVGPDGVQGSIVAHVIDLGHELEIAAPGALLDPEFARGQTDRLAALFDSRLSLLIDRVPTALSWGAVDVLIDRQAVKVAFRSATGSPPGTIEIRAALFPYDASHQTFVNVYETEALGYQAILDRRQSSVEYFAGTRQGTLAVVRRFVPAGIHHIAIGPDHILFLIGLLLLGGGVPRLLTIVTAFTVGHSITLSLAALDIVRPPAAVIEPAIALSIVYVGADNLLVAKDGRDVRAWIALVFGLVHGFGFASVLREMGLPPRALGWSLGSFNVGVEIGQILIVACVASVVAAIRRYSAVAGRRLAVAGSMAVIGAGAFWFVERVFFPGGV
jgi:hypothetical protein